MSKLSSHVAFEFDARHRPLLFQRDVDIGIADIDVVERGLNLRRAMQHARYPIGNVFGLLQRRTRDHFNLYLAVIGVDRRLKNELKCAKRGNRRQKRQRAYPHDPEPMVERPSEPALATGICELERDCLSLIQRPLQKRKITTHQPVFAVRLCAVTFEKIGSDHRRNQARYGQAEQNGHNNSEPKALEKLTCQAGH